MEHRKVVAYCRVACADQLAMKAQTEAISSIAKTKGYVVDEYYCDNGKSGATLDRPEMNRLMTDMRNGNVSAIVVKDPARLAKDLELGMKFFKIAQEHGVTIVTEHDEVYELISENLVSLVFQGADIVTPAVTSTRWIHRVWRKLLSILNEKRVAFATLKSQNRINF